MFANKDQLLKPPIRTASLSLCRSLSDSIRISPETLQKGHGRPAGTARRRSSCPRAAGGGRAQTLCLQRCPTALHGVFCLLSSPLPRCAAELRLLCLTAHTAGYRYKFCHKQTYSACKQLELPCLQQNCRSRERSQKRG